MVFNLATNGLEGRHTQLDGLRFLAVLIVFLHHAYLPIANLSYERGAGSGVELFFVISGFLITRILLKSQTGSLWNDLRTFYTRRALRIFPLYYLIITVMVISGNLPMPLPPLFYFYVFNIAKATSNVDAGPLDPFWTLCVEEQFYLICPLLVWKTPRRMLVATLATLILASSVTTIFLEMHASQDETPRCLLICSAQFLLWGALAGYADLHWKRAIDDSLLFFGGLALLVLWYTIDAGGSSNLLLLKGGAMALIVFGLWNSKNRFLSGFFRWPPFAYIGLISYGVYAYHEIVFVITINAMKTFPMLQGVNWQLLAFIFTILLASLSWHMFEAPINRFKRYFPYAKPAQPQEA